MATTFRTKELQNLSTTMTALSGVFTAGDVTVHAIYVSNTHSTNTIGFNLSLHDNQDPSQEKAKILHQVEIAPKSTDPSLGAAIPTGGPSWLLTIIKSFAPAA